MSVSVYVWRRKVLHFPGIQVLLMLNNTDGLPFQHCTSALNLQICPSNMVKVKWHKMSEEKEEKEPERWIMASFLLLLLLSEF